MMPINNPMPYVSDTLIHNTGTAQIADTFNAGAALDSIAVAAGGSSAEIVPVVMSSAAIGAVSALLLFLLACLLAGADNRQLRIMRALRAIRLRWLFFPAWICGFVIYDIGMSTGSFTSLALNAPMAVLHAFGIFLLNSDVSEIHSGCYENWLFMAFFSLVHAFAAFVSTMFVLKYFGFNILARIEMMKASHDKSAKEATYLFWGLNEASFTLARSIKDHYEELGRNDYRIIVVRTNRDDDDRSDSLTGIARIFEFLSLRTSEIVRLQMLGCLTTSTYANLSDISSGGDFTPRDIIGRQLRLRPLKRIIETIAATSGHLHMLFLSDDEDFNLHAVAELRHDSTMALFRDSEAMDSKDSCRERVTFHCHARYNSIHRVIEDSEPDSALKVKVVDSSHICVEMLKSNPVTLPARFVDVNADATVSSPFRALVVGFSEVGQDSVRFLYEFAAFIAPGQGGAPGARSPFSLDVVDRRMDDLAGTFVANSPAIPVSMPFIEGGEQADPLVTLHKMDCCSVEFYRLLETRIAELNYIVIATENDELNISLAVRIFKLAARHRADMRKFCILVRARNDGDDHIARIAAFYNRLWLAETRTGESVGTDAKADLPIVIFGLESQTYTFANVIDESLESKAVRFKHLYDLTTGAAAGVLPGDDWKAWREEYLNAMNIAPGSNENKMPSYKAVMSFRRKRGQNFSNGLHEATKRHLAAEALKKAGLDGFDWKTLKRKNLQTVYEWVEPHPGEDAKNRLQKISAILEVLAATEHIRWQSSHEILGYVYANTTDEIRMTHQSMVGWTSLDSGTQSYDNNVVDTTLGIKIEKQKPEKKDK